MEGGRLYVDQPIDTGQDWGDVASMWSHCCVPNVKLAIGD